MSYFYDGLASAVAVEAEPDDRRGEVLARKETMDLIRAYNRLDARPRRRLLDLAKSLNGEATL